MTARAPIAMQPASAHGSHPLLTAHAVRARCAEVAREAIEGRSAHFRWHEERLPAVAAYVTDVIRSRYPSLDVPIHSRWRHIEAGGVDRWTRLCAARGLAGDERARSAVDLVIPSVLLDAGAGARWKYREASTGLEFTRSEGLAVASVALYETGRLRDAEALASLGARDIEAAFQADAANPLEGLEGRAALLSRLAGAMRESPQVFGSPARLGNLVDHWRARSQDGRIPAAAILETLLQAFGAIWPGRLADRGVALGDCWAHPAAQGGLVPFHKLSQWLAYSLVEPLAGAGLEVTGLDALTGLPEYRNGGLILDLQLLEPREKNFLSRVLEVGEPAVVEWRAVTVIALDRLLPLVRSSLGVPQAAFPLSRLLEGGTWAAGRRIAAQRRPGGTPPVTVASDGTVF
jgi:Protein of unknown function (DUF1688)